ncbi:Hypothetical predicted protein [Pelobates cultripes]|uniref:Uncharacterized protein n=1 Tax=Pelobates cultripes TaxID=61616 RepID=A0AAD1WRU4_PELCU|nr:Hypothetical predicted protein [Pelobates cultripes]
MGYEAIPFQTLPGTYSNPTKARGMLELEPGRDGRSPGSPAGVWRPPPSGPGGSSRSTQATTVMPSWDVSYHSTAAHSQAAILQDGCRTPAACATCQQDGACCRGSHQMPSDHHGNLPQRSVEGPKGSLHHIIWFKKEYLCTWGGHHHSRGAHLIRPGNNTNDCTYIQDSPVRCNAPI